MKIFDAQIRSDTRTDDDLKNLLYFGTERVVSSAYPARRFEHAQDVIDFLDALLDRETRRLERVGLRGHVALGILPSARPRRRHSELWAALEERLADERVVAVGEAGAWEDTASHWALFDRHIELAKTHGLALLVTPPTDLKVNMTYKMMQRIEASALSPQRCIMNHLDARLVETVVREGFVAGVSVGPCGLEPRDAARILTEVLEAVGHSDNVVLSSGLRAGAADILGIPKTIVALEELEAPTDAVSEWVYGNAEEVYRTK